MKKDTLIGSLYSLPKDDPIPSAKGVKKSEDKSYHISYIDKVNKDHASRREYIEINWDKSIELHSKEWLEYIYDVIKKKVYVLRERVKGGDMDRSHIRRVEEGIISGVDVDHNLIELEKSMNYLEIKKEEIEKQDDSELEELKKEAKELGLDIKGRVTVKSLSAKIEEFKTNNK